MASLNTEIQLLKDTERGGAFFQATEIAYGMLREHFTDADGHVEARIEDPSFQEIAYLLTRAVLNCRAVDRAHTLFHTRYRLAEVEDHFNIKSLGARLIKDKALFAEPAERSALLGDAAHAYEAVYNTFESERGYTAVNVATLSLLRKETDKAALWARKAIDICEAETPSTPVEIYYNAATAAEAALVLKDLELAREQLQLAADANLAETATRATTFRQLRLICEHHGVNADEVLAAIRIPDVMLYAGHIIAPPGEAGRFPATEERSVARRIDDWLMAHELSAAYGSLAAGADILFAEACLNRGIKLRVILPFSSDDFVATSVAPSGDAWVKRFEHCIKQCEARVNGADITYATKDAFLSDEVLFQYGTRYAMGLAMLSAGHLATDVRLLAVYDGRSGSEYGTGQTVKFWKDHGLQADTIELSSDVEPKRGYSGTLAKSGLPKRRPKAIMFGDVVGFSKLKEQDIPRFHRDFMGPIAEHLKPYQGGISCRNSWGDAIYIVFEDAVAAARFGLELQRIIADQEFVPDGAESPLSLRLAVHYGPVFDGIDGFNQTPSCYGAHVTQAARIEPVTPPGVVYVTEAMAAELKLTDGHNITCDFVGPISSAKGFGNMLIYALRERSDLQD